MQLWLRSHTEIVNDLLIEHKDNLLQKALLYCDKIFISHILVE